MLMRAGVYLIVLLGIAAYGFFLHELYKLRLQGEEIEAEMASLSPTLKKIDLMEQQNASIQRRLETLKVVKNSRLPWSKVFQEVKNLTPPGLWLATVTMDMAESQKGAMVIHGETVSFENIGVFMLRLKGLPYFSEVNLVESKDHEVNRQLVTRFQITCPMADLPPVLQNASLAANPSSGKGQASPIKPNTSTPAPSGGQQPQGQNQGKTNPAPSPKPDTKSNGTTSTNTSDLPSTPKVPVQSSGIQSGSTGTVSPASPAGSTGNNPVNGGAKP